MVKSMLKLLVKGNIQALRELNGRVAKTVVKNKRNMGKPHNVGSGNWWRKVNTLSQRKNAPRIVLDQDYISRLNDYFEGGCCSDAFLMIQNYNLNALDNQSCKAVRLLAMDFSRAFDTVSHNILGFECMGSFHETTAGNRACLQPNLLFLYVTVNRRTGNEASTFDFSA